MVTFRNAQITYQRVWPSFRISASFVGSLTKQEVTSM